MFKSLKLRWKILLALVTLSVLPLFSTLYVLSGLTLKEVERSMDARFHQVANFAERSTVYSQREVVNYIKLMSRNADMVNAVYYASLTNDFLQLEEVIRDSQEIFNFDLLEVLDKEGNALLRIPAEEKTGANASGREHPVIAAVLEGEALSSVEPFDGRLAIVAASPVRLQQEQIGYLLGVSFLNDAFATRIKSLSGAEVAFFDESGIIAASHQELKGLLPSEYQKGESEIRLEGKPHTLFTKNLGVAQRGVLLALDLSDVVAARQHIREVMFIALVVAVGLAVLVSLAISRGAVRPLVQVTENLKKISEGGGDLTRTLVIHSRDEVGELAVSFNRFVGRLREMVSRTRSVSVDLAEATEKIRHSAREVSEGAAQQSHSLEESHLAIQGIEEAVSGIAESTGYLVDSAEESSSATLELGATIEQIASQMEKLFFTVEEVSSSINEMSVASQQIADNVEILSSSTEVTASSITELDASIKEIEENAEKTNRLSEEAAQDAQRGKEAVDETIEGIGAVREMVDKASATIQELGNQSSAIGKILTVIDDVADQTSLLALNAAIIAAQAGEHGKGFAVVADEIRELADRTAVSTKEIATIIGNLQSGTKEAVKAMTVGSERVHLEVARSRVAGTALDKIRSSTLTATEQVRGIVRATQEQSRGSRQITNSINEVAAMLGQIATAIKQQSDGTQHLARAAESMKEIASQGKLSTAEQAKGSRQINASMEKIRTMIERIDAATREQTERSRQVVEAVSNVRSISENNAARTAELDQVVEILARQTSALEGEVGAFKI
jgi:methyl-accepting chemotaxis protein